MSAGIGAAAVITVDDSGGADFTSIQAAVDAASEGDTIEVRSGTYVENVDVRKRLTLRGEGVVAVQAANLNDHVFDVTSNWVNISGVNAYGATASGNAGIYVGSGIAHSSISNCAASNNYYGIYLDRSNNNILVGNTANDNNYGIYLYYSSNNTLTDNNVSLKNGYGIRLSQSNNNALTNNIANDCWYGIQVSYSSNNMLNNNMCSNNTYGIILFGNSYNNTLTYNTMADNRYNFGVAGGIQNIDTSNTVDSKPIYYLVGEYSKVLDSTSGAGYIGVVNSNNITIRDITLTNNIGSVLFVNTTHSFIENMTVTNNNYGILLYSSNNITLINNNISLNYGDGLRLSQSMNNTITCNNANNNGDGISLYSSSNNMLTDNNVNSNGWNGIYIDCSSNNTLKSNTANNNNNGIELYWSSSNFLYYNNLINNTYENACDNSGTNQWDSGSEGNYYSDYTDTDSDGDGIGDTPYPCGGSVDRYPLMVPYTPPTSDYESKLIQQIGDFKVYLIEDGKKRHFTSAEALEWNGHSFIDVIEVSMDVINSFELGADISITQTIIDKYNALGGATTFGPPAGTGEQSGYPDSSGVICTYVNFQNGAIEYFTNGDQAGNAYAILNPFFDKWASMEYAKSVLGYPISDMSDIQTSSLGTPFKYQNFMNGTERGALEYNLSSGEVYVIHGAIYATWGAIGCANSVLGAVTSDELEAGKSPQGTTGRYSKFENGTIHWISDDNLDHLHKNEAFITYGDLDEFYTGLYGTNHWLGFPVMNQTEVDGHGYCKFEGGYIEWDGSGYNAFNSFDVEIKSQNDMDRYTPLESMNIYGEIIGGTPPFTFKWIIDELNSIGEIQNHVEYPGFSPDRSVIRLPFLESRIYEIQLEVTDSNGYTIKTEQTRIIISPQYVDSGFLPNPNGYQFVNFGSEGFSWIDNSQSTIPILLQTTGGYSWDYFRRAFGSDEVENNGIPSLWAMNFFYRRYTGAGEGGNCFGMSATSLIIFNSDNYRNNFNSWDLAGSTDLPFFGRNRHLDSDDSYLDINFNGRWDSDEALTIDYNDNGIWDPAPRTWGIFPDFIFTPTEWVEYYHPLQYTAASIEDKITYGNSSIVYNELKLRMASGNWMQNPMVIGGGSPGHAVVPIRIHESNDHRTGTVFIYDNVHPGDNNRNIVFDLIEGTARYGNADWSNIAAIQFSSFQRNDHQISNLDSVHNWAGHLLYTDAIGRHLGFHSGEFKDEIPGTIIVNPWDQSENDQFLETYYISNLNLKRELYGVDNGVATVSISRPNSLVIADVQVSPTSVDEINVPADGSSVEFISGEGTSTLGLMLDRENTEFSRVVWIAGSKIESGNGVQISFSDDLTKLSIINKGSPHGYDLYLEQIGSNPSSYNSLRPIVIGENSAVWITPLDWNDIDNNAILIEYDSGNDGTIESNEMINTYNITFLPPITTMDQFNLTDGSTLPIKFTVRDRITNEFIYDDTVNLTITNSTGHLITYFTNGTGTDSVRINSEEEQYLANLNTIDFPQLTIGEIYTIQVTFGDVDTLRGYTIAHFTLINDTPPAAISNLTPTASTTWLNFTWTNPLEPDFNHTELYLNGTFLNNIPAPQNYYNITGLLPDTSYELSTRTVDTSGNINLTWVNDTASTLPASGTTLNLYTGWNLISLPLIPEDTSITSLLSPINGNYSIVWEYNASDTSDHWKKYDPGVPFGNDLINMEPGKGYWIMMTSDDTLPISGTAPESTDIDLKTSWNLVGFNSLDSQPIAEALSPINGNYSIVWAYDASDTADHWKKYDPGVPFGNDLINVEPGRGYWIMMTSEGILKI
ncbi:right-handed parallel beta-helix repeat-containing protein [bacterium]|nr:right-handed parallel beta-helix repeat-containing protein [bacterium]